MKRIAQFAGCLLLLLSAPGVKAQMQVGDNLSMNLNGIVTAGYMGGYGDQIPSSHSLEIGGNAQLNGSYYNPNFLNFSVSPYYNQSRADSDFQSLTDSSGVTANANMFTGSHFPAFATYTYTRNDTGTFGLTGNPNFTTVGSGQGFGIGWSALLPDWPTFSVSYSQGTGSGTLYGTNEETYSSTHTLNLRSTYEAAGWLLGASFQHISLSSDFPSFLSGETNKSISDSSGNYFGVNATHTLPWNGSIGITFNHSNYSGDYGSTLEETNSNTNYSLNTETVNVNFRPAPKLGLFLNQSYTDNLDGYLYQNIINSGAGVPVVQVNSQSNSSLVSGGASYNFTNYLYAQAQLTYFDQSYYGKTYEGTYLSGTVGYGKRILNTFTVNATVIESSNKFANNSLGFIGNLNGFRHLGAWELSGGASYAQNVQTLLVTYTESYYNYNLRLHRRLIKGAQWTGAFNGNHSGFSQEPGTVNKSEGFSTSLSVRRLDFTANYIQASGQSVLTSTGIQPLPPTPGLPLEGLIVYNGKSYGAGINLTPIPRLIISGNYSNAQSDTLSNGIFSNNKTNIFYGQVQYRLRKISLLGGFTKFGQSISAVGPSQGNDYAYFIGVTRWFNFF